MHCVPAKSVGSPGALETLHDAGTTHETVSCESSLHLQQHSPAIEGNRQHQSARTALVQNPKLVEILTLTSSPWQRMATMCPSRLAEPARMPVTPGVLHASSPETLSGAHAPLPCVIRASLSTRSFPASSAFHIYALSRRAST
jgi:hypothetical protein